MTSLTSLIKRIEAATEGSRELDLAILRATDSKHWRLSTAWPDNVDIVVEVVHDDCEVEIAPDVWRSFTPPQVRTVPLYTASLDAALTLLPDGRGWIVGNGRVWHDEPLGGARITSLDGDTVIAEAEAATPCLALLAAILRARQTEGR